MIKVEVYDGTSWNDIELDSDSTVQNLLNKHGSDIEGGFIPTSSRFMVGSTVVDKTHVLSDGDRVAYSQPNKVGG